ncbi:MAG: NADPH-dependent oxidoreductase [Acidobacteria bacterium]|nr:MAG: NADPH-dependent oxidoreductase [Acidobacteriota bacterium]
MNDIIRLLQAHRSERSYKPDPIPDEILDEIIESAHRAPTSINTQTTSIVVIKDAERRKRISEITGGQPWVAKAPVFLTLVADLNKTRVGLEKRGATQQIQHSLEGVIASTVDVGIALGTLIVAARSFGLGIVPIGAIRRDPQAMIDLLELPEYTFPVVGIAMGYVEEPATQKPRLPIESFRHNECYQAENLRPAIDAYDLRLSEYWKQIGRSDGISWSENTADKYSLVYFPKVKPVAAKQGFTCED